MRSPMRNEHDTDDLKRLAPTLASLPKADPFVVPEGFFERFPHQVQAQVTKPPASPWLPVWAKRLALALPLTAAVAGAWWLLHAEDAPVPQVAVEIPEAGIDELELLDAPEAFTELAEEHATLNVLPATSLDLNDEELAVWLENESTDPSELIAEL